MSTLAPGAASPDGVVARRRPSPGQRLGVGLTLGLALAAWALLAAAEVTPWDRYLHHDDGAASLGGAAGLVVFVAGWVLMLAAMMLPTTYPLVSRFSAMVGRRRDGGRLVALLVAGYLSVWVVAGLAARAVDQGLHALDERAGFVADRSWVLAGAALAVAGAYQLTGAKARCLDRCRDPRAVLFSSWHGRNPRAEAFEIGRRHGASCLGCCWALMLVLFGIGAGNLGWMLAAAAAMTAEKVAPRGDRLTVPIGVALLAAAIGVAAAHV